MGRNMHWSIFNEDRNWVNGYNSQMRRLLNRRPELPAQNGMYGVGAKHAKRDYTRGVRRTFNWHTQSWTECGK